MESGQTTHAHDIRWTERSTSAEKSTTQRVYPSYNQSAAPAPVTGRLASHLSTLFDKRTSIDQHAHAFLTRRVSLHARCPKDIFLSGWTSFLGQDQITHPFH